MQMATAAVQTGTGGDPNAWNWTQNAIDAVNLFSNGGKNDDKVQDAVRFENYIINGYAKEGIAAHVNSDSSILRQLTAVERENMALTLYGGYAAACNAVDPCIAGSLFYIPVCTGSISSNKNNSIWTCSGSDWTWAVNDATNNPDLTAQYICPAGSDCWFNDPNAVLYVSNNKYDSWYNSLKQGGVTDNLQ